MSPHQYLAVIRRFWGVVVVAAVLGAGGAWGLSQIATPTYTATASVYFSLDYGNTATDLNQGSTYTQSQMLSFAQLAQSRLVLGPVIDKLGLSETTKALAGSISVNSPQNTVILDIAATDKDRAQASRVANAVAESLSSNVEKIAPKGLDGRTIVSARIIEPAAVPLTPSAPNIRTNVIAGLLLGLIVGILILVLRELFDTRVRSALVVTSLTSIPLLGSIEREEAKRFGLVMVQDPLNTAAEGFRQLRANLAYVAVESTTLSIVVTSSVPGEGKSMIASNLAIALSESDRRVLLVDADLRRPAITGYFGVEGEVGLTTLLVGRAEIDDVVQPSGTTGSLDILPAGSIPPNPSELLSSRAMAGLVEEFKQRYDVILLDTAPILSVADAAILARLADGALVIADRTKVHRAQLAQTLDSLDKSGAQVLGIVLNRVLPSKNRQTYYHTPAVKARKPRLRRGSTTQRTGNPEDEVAVNARLSGEPIAESEALPDVETDDRLYRDEDEPRGHEASATEKPRSASPRSYSP